MAVQEGIAQPQLAFAAMGQHMHGRVAARLAQRSRHLRQTILAGIDIDHLHIGCQALEQARWILDAAVDEDDFAGARGSNAGGR
nr:hypothetical protein [Delftia sp. PS-11]